MGVAAELGSGLEFCVRSVELTAFVHGHIGPPMNRGQFVASVSHDFSSRCGRLGARRGCGQARSVRVCDRQQPPEAGQTERKVAMLSSRMLGVGVSVGANSARGSRNVVAASAKVTGCLHRLNTTLIRGSLRAARKPTASTGLHETARQPASPAVLRRRTAASNPRRLKSGGVAPTS